MYDERHGGRARWIGTLVALATCAALGFLAMRTTGGGFLQSNTAPSPLLSNGSVVGSTTDAPVVDRAAAPTTTTTAAPAATVAPAAAPTTAPSPSSTIADASTSPTTTSTPETDAADDDDDDAPAASTADETGDADESDDAGADADADPGIVAEAAVEAIVEPVVELGYPAAPDGTPLPVIVTYDTGTVRLTGMVPSDAMRERLVGLAVANSQDDEPDVSDDLIVNEAVPASVGVRVIELQSARFGEGRARLSPAHIEQIDRVAGVMQALPHVSLLVIGHADQRGDEVVNLGLSEERASTVVDYLVYLGIEPTRLSMRGAGESDLLTLDDDAQALALNRRTEFIFYGVLL